MAVAVGALVVPVVGVVPVVVELPPQAARSTIALSATRQNKTGLSCFLVVEIPKVIDLFNCIFFSSFGKVLVTNSEFFILCRLRRA